MEALQGDFGSRAAGVVAAGCDAALHCSGKMDEMVAVAASVPPLGAEAEARLARAMATTLTDDDDGPSFAEVVAKRDALLAMVKGTAAAAPSYPQQFGFAPSQPPN
jgi:beta-N-acetylhexosaminidase